MQITLDYDFHPSPRYGHGKSAHAALNRLIEKRRSTFEKYLRAFRAFQADLLEIPVDECVDLPGEPYWGNGFFPGLDAVSLVAPEYFDTLTSGDVLFIDSSHRSFTNSDVTVFYLDILPRLKAGVMIHIHDIFLPYDYPPEWGDRYYNEQYLLACTLLARCPSYEIHLANTFITYDPRLGELVARIFHHPGLVEVSKDKWITRTGWSLWMRRL